MGATKLEKLYARYRTAMHGMQSGVAMEMEVSQDSGTTPKHLRVGVNSALVDSSALASLLMKKGLFTEEEYLEALALGAEKERDEYQRKLSTLLGRVVTLA